MKCVVRSLLLLLAQLAPVNKTYLSYFRQPFVMCYRACPYYDDDENKINRSAQAHSVSLKNSPAAIGRRLPDFNRPAATALFLAQQCLPKDKKTDLRCGLL